MANFQPGSIVSEIRGSVGDVTYSRNRGGAIVKQKLVQTNPDTAKQQAVRLAMAEAVSDWQNADQSTQDKWGQFAQSQVVGKNISRKISRAGYNEFISRYMNRIAIEGAGTDFEPLPKVRINPVITSIVQATSSILLNYDCLRSPSNVAIAVFATPPISPGINHINPSLMRVIGFFEPSSQVDSEELFTMYDDYYNLVPGDAGKKIGLAIKAVNTDNYAAGGFFFAQIIISAGLVPSVVPSVVQSSNGNANAVNSITASLPAVPSAGRLLVVWLARTNGTNFNVPSGWTEVFRRNNSTSSIQCLIRITGGSESNSYTFTAVANANQRYVLYEVQDVNLTTPVFSSGSNIKASSTFTSASSVNLDPPAGSLAIAGIGYTANTSDIAFSNSFGNGVPALPHGQYLATARKSYTSAASGENTVISNTTARASSSGIIVLQS